MAISLGRSIGSPVFLFVQIVHGVSLFFLLLGLSRVLLGVAELTFTPVSPAASATPLPTTLSPVAHLPEQAAAAALRLEVGGVGVSRTAAFPSHYAKLDLPLTQRQRRLIAPAEDDGAALLEPTAAPLQPPLLPISTLLGQCFHVPLLSLFDSSVDVNAGDGVASLRRQDGGPTRFYLQHLLAALLCAYPLATLLQRRKFVLDFVATIYIVYWLFTDVMLQAALGGGTLHWWGAWLLGMAAMYAATYAICRRREMQEVKLTGGGGSAASHGPAAAAAGNSAAAANVVGVMTSATWLKDGGSNGEEMREMEEARSAFHDTFAPSAAAAVVSSAVASIFHDKTGSRGRGGAMGATSPQPVSVDMSAADDGQFKSKSV